MTSEETFLTQSVRCISSAWCADAGSAAPGERDAPGNVPGTAPGTGAPGTGAPGAGAGAVGAAEKNTGKGLPAIGFPSSSTETL